MVAAVAREQIVNCTMAAWQPPSTDSAAANFFAYADEDDGSCIFHRPGCTLEAATNFDSSANVLDEAACKFPWQDWDSYDTIGLPPLMPPPTPPARSPRLGRPALPPLPPSAPVSYTHLTLPTKA